EVEHRHFYEIAELLGPKDCLILNDSRVLPARIYGVKEGTGAHVEFLLLENKGNVFSREEILSRIWKDEVYVLDRTIDVNITRLRKKIGPYGKNIVTRLGFGYCFEY
ncbi:winged helix-turn-helix domain-containing protein, partial [Parabacteroides goldsteinii]|uniref:winged helix-turn-helix domain-containing protein n=1 Tax=Parabacteroides goldsteinii TaxID=328812 RepID=UPI003EC13E8D